MKPIRMFAIAAVVGALGWYLSDLAAQPPAAGSDIEILGHGPIHEAFAQPAGNVVPTAIVAKQPPAPVEELPPDVKPEGDHVVWIPGYWAFDNERNDFVWISGFWRNVPPDRVWVPGYWVADVGGSRWTPGYWAAPAATQTFFPPPPEPLAEAPPPAPNDGVFYVAGTWVYRDNRYLWRPGYWTPYRAGWMWTAPHYTWTPAGYVFVDGYWDYDFGRRGVLFAPAYFGPRYFAVNRVYRPTFAISTDLLFVSLFVRPSVHAYYFGDYYAPRYATLGFTPWLDYRYRGRYADPAWSYYAWHNRGTPRWEQDQRAVFTARQNGTSPPPPRRFDPQAHAQGQSNVNVNLVMPVQQMQTRNNVKFTQVSKTEMTTIKQQADQTTALATTRQNVERKIDANASRQQPVKADLPVQRVVRGGGGAPPPPIHPHVDPSTAVPGGKTGGDPAPPAKFEPKSTPAPKSSPPAPSPVPAPAPPTKNVPPTSSSPPTLPKFDPKSTPGTSPSLPQPAPRPAPVPSTPQAPNPAPKAAPTPAPKPNLPQPAPTPQVIPQPAPKVAPTPIPTPAPKAPPTPAPQPAGPPQHPPRLSSPPTPSQPPPQAPPKGKGKEKD